MPEYRQYELGSVCARLSSGKGIPASQVFNEGAFPVYGGNGLRGYTDHSNFRGDCAIIGRQGAFCGNVRYFNGEAYMTEHAVVVCANECHNTRYLAYLLSQMNLGRLSGQSAQPGLSVKTLAKQVIELPPLDVQNKVVAVLSSLDSKITLNEKINDNLYAQARAIKRQWVAKSKDRYELLPLNEVAAINPDTYSPKEAWEYVNYLDTSSITNGFIADIQHIVPSSEKLPSRARRKVAAGDVLFSTVRPNQNHFGIISDPLPNMLASTGFAAIRSKNPLVCNELIYLCLTELDFIEKMQQLAEQSTSTFPSIKPSDLGTCQIPCPKDESSDAFTDTLKSLFALIAENFRENSSLATMREALLPKLMSGEIDVSAVQL